MSESRSMEAIEVADQVELRLVDMSTGEMRRYRTTVEDVSADTIAVGLPSDKGVPIRAAVGDELIVALWKDFADHLFKARVRERSMGRVPTLVLNRPAADEIRRTPRREFFRVDARITTRVKAVVDGGERLVGAVMLDLSAGGCRLQSFTRLPADTPVILDFVLPFPSDSRGNDRLRPVRGLAGTARLVNTPETRSNQRRPIYFLGIEFGTLEPVMRNNILRYVAFRQREMIALQRERGEGAGRQDLPLEAVEQRLHELEQELAEAGQEVPTEVARRGPDQTPAASAPSASAPAARVPATQAPATQAPAQQSGSESDPSIDDLFAEPEAQKAGRAAPVPSGPELLPATGTAKGKTVLLVEDEADLRAVLSEALRQDGFAVVEASAGDEALLAAKAVPIDLVITDLLMPRMNGWRLIAALRERGVTVPVVIITAYMTEEGQEVLASRDINGFLVKPIDIEEMSRVVANALPSDPGRPRRILAVDDEEEVRIIVDAALSGAGYEVRTVESGHEALVAVKKFKPDLVLLDIVMPGLNGFQVCERLRDDPATRDVPVAMLTAKAAAEFVRRALSLKISGYLIKPVVPASLVERVGAILTPGG